MKCRGSFCLFFFFVPVFFIESKHGWINEGIQGTAFFLGWATSASCSIYESADATHLQQFILLRIGHVLIDSEEHFGSYTLPSYGAEMRGGTANTSVNISSQPIGSPLVSNPNVLLVMNLPSLDAFEDTVRPGGRIFVNSSLAARPLRRQDITGYHVPVTDMANELGAVQTASVILLTVYALVSGAISVDTLRRIVPLSIKRKSQAEVNMRAIDAGIGWYQKNCQPA